MSKSKKKKKQSAASIEAKAALRQEKAEMAAKQNRRALVLFGVFIIVAVFLIAMLIGSFNMGSSDKYTSYQYGQLESGMSYEEVVSIMGDEGVTSTDLSADGSAIYKWSNDDDSYITVTVRDGVVVGFNQNGVSK